MTFASSLTPETMDHIQYWISKDKRGIWISSVWHIPLEMKKNGKKKCIIFKCLQDVYGLNNLSEPKIPKFDQVGANFTIWNNWLNSKPPNFCRVIILICFFVKLDVPKSLSKQKWFHSYPLG